MRQWEARGCPPHQCMSDGTRWVLERAIVPPGLGEVIVKAAYIPILQEKIARRLGGGATEDLVRRIRAEGRHLDKKYGSGASDAMDKWWNDTEFMFEELLEAAFKQNVIDIPRLPQSMTNDYDY